MLINKDNWDSAADKLTFWEDCALVEKSMNFVG